MPVQSPTSCEAFWKLVTQYKTIFGKDFDKIGFAGRGSTIVRGAELRSAKNGCELHRLSGLPEKCRCAKFDEHLKFVSRKGCCVIFYSTERAAKICLAIGFLGTLLLTNASGRSRMGEATVTQLRGLPCFSIGLNETRRGGEQNLFALFVSELSTQPPPKIWAFRFPGDSKGQPLPPRTSICYGEIPKGAEGNVAKPLQIDAVYSVYMNARSEDPGDSTQGYYAKFCIKKSAGIEKVVQINSESQEWKVDICPSVYK